MQRVDIPEHDRRRLSLQQLEIYNGLKTIGEEIAAFYLDGTKIINGHSLETASYLLGHTLREIEGGLRDILVVDKKESEKCSECNRPKPITEGHIDSICEALGVDKNHPLARKWHEVAVSTGTLFNSFNFLRGENRDGSIFRGLEDTTNRIVPFIPDCSLLRHKRGRAISDPASSLNA